jgi:hypothetical protein
MFLVICFLLAGCAHEAQTPPPSPPSPADLALVKNFIEDNRRYREGCLRTHELKIGMSTQQVLSICGKPFVSRESVTAEGKKEGWGYAGPHEVEAQVYFIF